MMTSPSPPAGRHAGPEPDADDALAHRAWSFALGARRVTTMPALAGLVTATVRPLGMTAAASGYVSGPRATSGNPFHFTDWPDDWIAIYVAENFLNDDPLPRWARASGNAITWRDLIALLRPRDPGRRVVETGMRNGFTEGMAIPTRAADNSVGLVSIGGDRPPLTAAEQLCLTIIGRAAFEAGDRILRDGDPGAAAPILTAREMECLAALVQGHSDREISALLGISEPTIRFHLNNAREKLGAISRTHLAALAIAQGYISL